MNHSTVVAIALISSVSAPSILAAPPLLDFPGPGYREQVKLVSPKRAERELQFNWIGPTQVPGARQLDNSKLWLPLENADGSQPFSEPIRLFDTKAGGPKAQVK